MEDNLLFSISPSVIIANVTFNTKVVIQYNDTPMLEVVQEVTVKGPGFTTKIPIYHNDGTQLAVVKGSRLFLTEEGKKAGIIMQHLPGITVCKLNHQTMFEIRRNGAAAISTTAELFTPDGSFLKWSNDSVSGMLFNNSNAWFQGLQLGPGGKGIQIGYPNGAKVIMNPGSSITGPIGILIGTSTQNQTVAGIHLSGPCK